MNCLTNPFSQKNANELFTFVLININRILQADPDLAMYNMLGTTITKVLSALATHSQSRLKIIVVYRGLFAGIVYRGFQAIVYRESVTS